VVGVRLENGRWMLCSRNFARRLLGVLPEMRQLLMPEKRVRR
jgi:hypothetical protein